MNDITLPSPKPLKCRKKDHEGQPLVLLSLLSIALFVTWLTIPFGRSIGLIDKPDARKQHRGEIPLTGGIAIFVTILIGTVVLGVPPYTHEMLVIASLIFLIGVYDDFSHLHAGIRLLVQYVSGILLATYGGIAIEQVGDLLALGQIPLLLLSIPLTALSVAGLSNAYNMIDGIDGLAASMIIVPLLVLYLLALSTAHPMANTLILMVVPVFIFLCFNLGPNLHYWPKIFLGDGGSVTMGFLVTASLIYFSQGEQALIRPVTALWLVTVPLMDMLATMLRRWQRNKKLMDADRSHLHYTLIDMGLSSRQTLLLLVFYASLCAALGLALERLAEIVSLVGYILLFIGHCAFVVKAGVIKARIRRKNPSLDN